MTLSWKKVGKIFDASKLISDNPLSAGYAQSPQAVVLEDRVRVYFSTRLKEPGSSKFLSHVAFVDYSKDLKTTLGKNADQVIPLGELGCFDEHGIFPFSPFDDRGSLSAYSCGWSRRISVSVETATGYCMSADKGQTFQKYGTGPIMASDMSEPFLVGDSFVRYFNGTYHMWYMFGERWMKETETSAPDRVYKIGHAVSNDGICWVRDHKQIVTDQLHANECQALPSVVYFNNQYHMVFCYRDIFGFRDNPEKAYRIGYAVSQDCRVWQRCDENLGLGLGRIGEWDGAMMCYPHLKIICGTLFLFYNGNRFGQEGFGVAILQSSGLSYTQNESRMWHLVSHFQSLDKAFKDELLARTSIEEYTVKLVEKSCRYEVWDQDRLVGILAVYFNRERMPFVYISNISVLSDYQGKGIAKTLLSKLVDYARKSGLLYVELEVSADNNRAQAFYRKQGFVEAERKTGILKLRLNLSE
ncbi:MAG: GNAT family N-acetyltransferase [Pseudobdellovibrionaceae bacterium]|jgi:ribosomal protein S18 acetylase RimI-like enzyme|nr:GNAT family N-acetyltransferase [Pseudobdellovibrionaceae bacterium]